MEFREAQFPLSSKDREVAGERVELRPIEQCRVKHTWLSDKNLVRIIEERTHTI
jgi:hypothetical protein